MVDERGRAGAFSRGARGGTPRKKKTEAEGVGCGALFRQPRTCLRSRAMPRMSWLWMQVCSVVGGSRQVRRSFVESGSSGRCAQYRPISK